MRAGPVVVIMLVIVAVVAGAMFIQKKQAAQQAAAPAPPASSGPPANAQFLIQEQTALMIMSSVVGSKEKDRAAVAAMFIDKWVPDTGWTGEIKKITKEADGTALRMWCSAPATFMGGGFWVIAVVPGPDPDITTRDNVWVQGRIDNVEVKSDGSPIPMCRIVLKDCKLVLVQKVP